VLEAFGIAVGVVFVAELGDKSQLQTLTFAARYRWTVVLAGISVATAALMALSVTIGGVAGDVIPQRALQLMAGAAFLGFAAWTLFDADDEDEHSDTTAEGRRGTLSTVIGTFALAELGDKTMLTTITLASTHGWLGTWIGATLGMIAANGLALVIGDRVGTRLPERVIRFGAAGLFAVFGVLLLFGVSVG
jgi:putative Ca2+/H+ antiporter (TMEM165/GDT1 family)